MTMSLPTHSSSARVPLRPVLASSELGIGRSKGVYPSVLQAGEAALVTSGRVAVALALRELRLPAESEVLIPAYHCSSMVEPVVWAGAKPVFFRVASDGGVDLEDVRRRVNGRTRALLAAHYFGFPQEMLAIREFCDRNGISLIEDCAHAFYGSVAGRPLGSYGDYACASPWKFFPAYDGGCLVSARRPVSHITIRTAGWRYELKSAINALEQAFEYGRMPVAGVLLGAPLRAKDSFLRWLKQQRPHPPAEIGPSALDGGFVFEPAWIDKKMSLTSRSIIRIADGDHIAIRRRENYLRLLQGLADLPGARPFHRDLPDGVVPHVFPLFVDDPVPVFAELRRQSVPMLRFGEWLWAGVDESVCPTSIALSRHLAQFPCHQGLKTTEVDWLVATIRATLLRHHGGTASG
jgi:dTDP-4-amino-4,6-dideoxygalactose transaminase